VKPARNALFPAVFTIFIPFSGDRACIKDYVFIDPPYNTGNDFIYADDFMRSQDEENRQMGMYDEDENRLFKNNDSNGRFHSDWCSMMYSRLMLARNLLTDDGVIFIIVVVPSVAIREGVYTSAIACCLSPRHRKCC